jgi:transcriptional regulator with XRE-family HTH domain
MNHSRPACYLRSYRKRSGLSQKELALLIGYPNDGSVSRHERLYCVPPFHIALGYEAIFRIPSSNIFPAAYSEISERIEARIEDLAAELRESTVRGHRAVRIARGLEWMWERKNQGHFEALDDHG